MLRNVMASIFTTQATTGDAQRRARNVIVIALGMIALAALSALLTLNQEQPLAGQVARVTLGVDLQNLLSAASLQEGLQRLEI